MRATGWRAVAPAAALLLAAVSARAETVAVRSGEHDGFTRIVVNLGAPAAWRLDRSETGYELAVDRPDLDFDLSRAFDLIARNRVADLAPAGGPGRLAVTLGCDCHAEAFATPGGAIVIDIRDGPPPPGEAAATPAAEAEGQPPGGGGSGAGSAAALMLAAAAGDGSDRISGDRLDLYWELAARGILAGRARAPGPGTGPEAPAATPAVAAGAGPDAAAAGSVPPVMLPPPPAPPPAASPPPPAASPPPLPAGAGLEQDLLYQLGRAASQGLVDAELPAAPAGAARAPEDPAVPAAPETDAGATPPLSAGAGRAIRATTVFDRDLAPPEAPADQTPEGDPCTPTGALDVPAWGDDRPATTQLAEARAALVGEFDRPDPAAVLAYARLLVFLGFGAEARQVLDAFDAGGDEADTLRALARAVDGTDGPAPGLLRGQAACEGPAALWALLDPVPPGPGEPVAHGAAIRAFSALPGHLRRAVGPRLTEVFLARGESDAARAVQDAIDRALTAEDGPAALDDATFAALSGDDGRALALLAEIARENGEDAPEAVARGLELRLERGLPVPPDEAATAAAFAWEYRATPVGPRLAAAAIAATAAAGDPGAAFDLLAEWRAALPEGLRRAAEERILDEIAGLEDPDAFLTAWFAHQDAIAAADPSAGLRRKLSGRLVGAGLPGAAAALLDTAPEATAEWRLARARAALAVGEPDLALDLTAGLDLPGVADLRADALTATGDLAAAAGVALDAGSSRADRAAWRAAAGRAGAGPEMLERSLRMLGAAPPPPAPPPPAAPGGPAGGPAGQSPAPGPGGATGQGGTTGPIGQGRALLAASAATRESLRALLAAAGAGAPPAAAP